MTFLKKLGQIIASVAGIAAGVGPLVLPFLGAGKAATIEKTVVNDLTQIGQQVVNVESIIQTPGSGAEKLRAVTPLVASIVQGSEMLYGKKVYDEALFIRGSQKIADGTADILNSVHPDEAKHAGS